MATTEPPLSASTFCSQCGRPLPPSELVTLAGAAVCADCKPVLLRRLQQGTAARGLSYKGFWIRLVAKFLDGLVEMAAVLPLMAYFLWDYFHAIFRAAAGGRQPDPNLMFQYFGQIALGELLAVVLVWLYNTVMLGNFQATLGKMAIGAKVVRPDGSRISWGQAAGRSAMEIVSGMILYLGYLVAAFDHQKRTLHDMVASTRVVAG